MNQKERRMGLINNYNNLSFKENQRKEIFYKLFKERFKEITELIHETNFDDLI